MQSIRVVTFFLLCSFGAYPCIGQTASLVRDLFYEPGEVIWVNSFDGKVNALHHLKLHLGYDGNTYRGYLELAADEMIELEGKMQDDELMLTEIGEDGLVSGHIVGKLSEDRFSGSWWSANYDRTADLKALRSGLIELKKFEPRFLRISGEHAGRQVEGNIFIETPSIVSGIWWMDDDCYQLVGACSDNLCREMQLINRANDVHWQLNFGTGAEIKLTDGYKESSIQIDQQYELKGRQRLTYQVMADIRYPDVGNTGFNNWVESMFDSWYVTIADNTSPESPGAAQRWQLMVSSWIDVYSLEEEVISGFVTQYRSSDGGYQRFAFVYDLKAGEEVLIEEIVRDQDALDALMQASLPVDDDQQYEHWVPTTHGVAMVTPFDIVNGERVVMIPYDQTRKTLRKKGAIGKLMD